MKLILTLHVAGDEYKTEFKDKKEAQKKFDKYFEAGQVVSLATVKEG
jgi:hypothetical protein